MPHPRRWRDPHMKCPACGTNLVMRIKFLRVYGLVCAIGALLVAALQRSEGIVLVVRGLIYTGVFIVAGIFVLLPLFPVKVVVNKRESFITKLGL